VRSLRSFWRVNDQAPTAGCNIPLTWRPGCFIHRAVIFTDDQQHDSGRVRLDHVPLIYTFNLAGYRPSALPAGEQGRYTLGGLTDATFMAVLEAGRDADWPF